MFRRFKPPDHVVRSFRDFAQCIHSECADGNAVDLRAPIPLPHRGLCGECGRVMPTRQKLCPKCSGYVEIVDEKKAATMKRFAAAIAALLMASCSTSLYDFGHSAPRTIEVRDCRVVTGKGETSEAWFLMTKDGAMIYVDRGAYKSVHVGQAVCGAWKDKADAKIEKKSLPEIDCSDPWPSDQQCAVPLKV